MITQRAPAARRRLDGGGRPLGVRRVAAGEADDRLAVVRRHQVGRAVRRAGHVDRDAAGREQVGREGRAGGVRRNGAHRGQEDGGGRGLVAQRLEAGAVAPDLGGSGGRAGRDRLALRERLGEVRELGDAGQRPLAAGDLVLATGDGLVDAGPQRAVREGGLDAAALLDPAQLVPAGAGQVVGQLLDGVGAAGRVGHVRDVGLVDQQARGVARDPAAERVRHAERGVEGQHGDGVRSPDAGREGRDGGAEHVHPGVVLAHHRAAGHRVLALRAGADGGAAELEDPGPQPAGGAELGDGRELLVGGRVAELDQAGGLVQGDARLGQRPEVRRADGDAVAQLLGVGGTEVVHGGRVDDDAEGARLAGQPGHRDQRLRRGRAASASPHPRPDRVGAEVGAVGGGDAAVLQQGDERPGAGDRVGRGVEHDGGQVEEHLGERGGQVPGLEAGAELDPQRGDAAVEVDQGRLVRRLRVRAGDVGTDVPVTGARGPAVRLHGRRAARACRAG